MHRLRCQFFLTAMVLWNILPQFCKYLHSYSRYIGSQHFTTWISVMCNTEHYLIDLQCFATSSWLSFTAAAAFTACWRELCKSSRKLSAVLRRWCSWASLFSSTVIVSKDYVQTYIYTIMLNKYYAFYVCVCEWESNLWHHSLLLRMYWLYTACSKSMDKAELLYLTSCEHIPF